MNKITEPLEHVKRELEQYFDDLLAVMVARIERFSRAKMTDNAVDYIFMEGAAQLLAQAISNTSFHTDIAIEDILDLAVKDVRHSAEIHSRLMKDLHEKIGLKNGVNHMSDYVPKPGKDEVYH